MIAERFRVEQTIPGYSRVLVEGWAPLPPLRDVMAAAVTHPKVIEQIKRSPLMNYLQNLPSAKHS